MTDVVMPQMGESIAEGTIVRWVKKVGDTVERDEPLFEISTDKVDAEIPSPVAGVISEIRAKEGETVPVNSVVAVIAPAGSRPAAAAPAPVPAPAVAHSAPPPPAAPVHSVPAHPPAPPVAAAPAPTPYPAEIPSVGAFEHDEANGRQRSSPLVRKIAKEHQVDVSRIAGTGIGGRVTKNDILAFIGGAAHAAPARPAAPSAPTPQAPAAARPAQTTGVAAGVGMAGRTVPMSVMRKRIAEHMVASRRTSAHVHSVFEINFHTVDKIRKAKKAEFEQQGGKLTYLSFIIKACADALKAVPVVNASVDGDNIVYHEHVNIGIAVALDWGLIVPVVKDADKKSLLEISKTVVDLAARARAKQLKPEEVSGGTFTITNPGVFGALVGMPIINQPQLAIVSVGAVEKRVVVVDDAIAIRPMALFSIGFDHRVIDGAVADEFLVHVKHTLEHWNKDV